MSAFRSVFPTWILVCAVLTLPRLAHPLLGQEQPAQSPDDARRGLQVAVPEGRPGVQPVPAPARENGPQGPAPRNADGRVLLGGATPAEKGVWQPGPVVGNPLGIDNISSALPLHPRLAGDFGLRR